jgi:hypothetical protein|tara:strand:+ start:5466 stop:5768 length:303 start_codon:yes stop_codon:yes gene_type:complete
MDKSLYYFDPNHGGCLRIVNKISKDSYIINGAYGSDEEKKGYWAATAKKTKLFDYKDKKYNFIVDFSMKSEKIHKNVYYARMIGRKIHWQDGNTWQQMYA